MSASNGGSSIPFTKPSPEEVIRTQAENCQNLVNSYLATPNHSSTSEFIKSLQLTGATSEEVNDYVSQFKQRSSTRSSKHREAKESDHIEIDEEFQQDIPSTPEGLSLSEIEEYRQKQDYLIKQKDPVNEDEDH